MESDDATMAGAEVIRRLEAELRPLLLRWDPFGVGPGCPPDEYDSYFGRVLSALRAHGTEEALTDCVSSFETPGPDPDLQHQASRRTGIELLAWWDQAQHWVPNGVADAP